MASEPNMIGSNQEQYRGIDVVAIQNKSEVHRPGTDFLKLKHKVQELKQFLGKLSDVDLRSLPESKKPILRQVADFNIKLDRKLRNLAVNIKNRSQENGSLRPAVESYYNGPISDLLAALNDKNIDIFTITGEKPPEATSEPTSEAQEKKYKFNGLRELMQRYPWFAKSFAVLLGSATILGASGVQEANASNNLPPTLDADVRDNSSSLESDEEIAAAFTSIDDLFTQYAELITSLTGNASSDLTKPEAIPHGASIPENMTIDDQPESVLDPELQDGPAIFATVITQESGPNSEGAVSQVTTRGEATLRGEANRNVQLAMIPGGTALEVLRTVQGENVSGSTTWYEVNYNGQIGHVHESVITITGRQTVESNPTIEAFSQELLQVPVWAQNPDGTFLKIADSIDAFTQQGHPFNVTEPAIILNSFVEQGINVSELPSSLAALVDVDENGQPVAGPMKFFPIEINGPFTTQSPVLVTLKEGNETIGTVFDFAANYVNFFKPELLDAGITEEFLSTHGINYTIYHAGENSVLGIYAANQDGITLMGFMPWEPYLKARGYQPGMFVRNTNLEIGDITDITQNENGQTIVATPEGEFVVGIDEEGNRLLERLGESVVEVPGSTGEVDVTAMSPEMRAIYENANFGEPQMVSADGKYTFHVSQEQLTAMGIINFNADPNAVQAASDWSLNTIINSVNTAGAYQIQRGQVVYLARSPEIGDLAHRDPDQRPSDDQNYISGVLDKVDFYAVTVEQMNTMREAFLNDPENLLPDHIPLMIPNQGVYGFAYFDRNTGNLVLVTGDTPRDIPTWRNILSSTSAMAHSTMFTALRNGAAATNEVRFNQDGLYNVYMPDILNHLNDENPPPTITIST